LTYEDYRPPVMDGKNFFETDIVTTFAKGNFNKVDALLLGTNTNESTAFIIGNFFLFLAEETADHILRDSFSPEMVEKIKKLYPFGEPFAILAEILSHTGFTCPCRNIARSVSAKLPVYHYEFARLPSYSTSANLGVIHAEEIPFVFKNSLPKKTFDQVDAQLSVEMVTYWTQFAHGKELSVQTKDSQVKWPTYTASTDFQSMRLSENLQVIPSHHGFCDLWDEASQGKQYRHSLSIKEEHKSKLHDQLNYVAFTALMWVLANPKKAWALIGLVLFGVVFLLFKLCFGSKRKQKVN